VNVPDE